MPGDTRIELVQLGAAGLKPDIRLIRYPVMPYFETRLHLIVRLFAMIFIGVWGWGDGIGLASWNHTSSHTSSMQE